MDCRRLRDLGNIMTKQYDKTTHTVSGSAYKSKVELAVRNFIRLYLNKDPGYGIVPGTFVGYKEIIEFVRGFGPTADMRISKQSISNLKHRRIVLQMVPSTQETRDFVAYVKVIFPDFCEEKFLRF